MRRKGSPINHKMCHYVNLPLWNRSMMESSRKLFTSNNENYGNTLKTPRSFHTIWANRNFHKSILKPKCKYFMKILTSLANKTYLQYFFSFFFRRFESTSKSRCVNNKNLWFTLELKFLKLLFCTCFPVQYRRFFRW